MRYIQATRHRVDLPYLRSSGGVATWSFCDETSFLFINKVVSPDHSINNTIPLGWNMVGDINYWFFTDAQLFSPKNITFIRQSESRFWQSFLLWYETQSCVTEDTSHTIQAL